MRRIVTCLLCDVKPEYIIVGVNCIKHVDTCDMYIKCDGKGGIEIDATDCEEVKLFERYVIYGSSFDDINKRRSPMISFDKVGLYARARITAMNPYFIDATITEVGMLQKVEKSDSLDWYIDLTDYPYEVVPGKYRITGIDFTSNMVTKTTPNTSFITLRPVTGYKSPAKLEILMIKLGILPKIRH